MSLTLLCLTNLVTLESTSLYFRNHSSAKVTASMTPNQIILFPGSAADDPHAVTTTIMQPGEMVNKYLYAQMGFANGVVSVDAAHPVWIRLENGTVLFTGKKGTFDVSMPWGAIWTADIFDVR